MQCATTDQRFSGIGQPTAVDGGGCTSAREILNAKIADTDKGVAKFGGYVVGQSQIVQRCGSGVCKDQCERDVIVFSVWNGVASTLGQRNVRQQQWCRVVTGLVVTSSIRVVAVRVGSRIRVVGGCDRSPIGANDEVACGIGRRTAHGDLVIKSLWGSHRVRVDLNSESHGERIANRKR